MCTVHALSSMLTTGHRAALFMLVCLCQGSICDALLSTHLHSSSAVVDGQGKFLMTSSSAIAAETGSMSEAPVHPRCCCIWLHVPDAPDGSSAADASRKSAAGLCQRHLLFRPELHAQLLLLLQRTNC